MLTARGGLASHAAVVARGWGIPAVVGAADVRFEKARVIIAGRLFEPGDQVSIDGSTGEVFAGELPGSWEIAPEAATLLAWADELGIAIATRAEEQAGAEAAAGSESVTEISAHDVVRALAVKGSVTPDQLAEALLVDRASLERIVAQLVADRVVEDVAGQMRLSADGKLSASDLFASDRSSFGELRAVGMLDEFHALDGRMKNLVTAWQVRDVAGEQMLNDHTDAAYDAHVMDDLAALHADTVAWLAPLSDSRRRFTVYMSRLGRAFELARGGDQRFVASPRVDSYHSVWFELHEDLIRLAGRKRSESG